MYEQRRQFLNNLINNNELVGLEIGGLDRPLVVRRELPEGSEILYADHLSTEDLKRKYKADQTVNIDACWWVYCMCMCVYGLVYVYVLTLSILLSAL